MNLQIEWIKRAIGLCTEDQGPNVKEDESKREQFRKLEEEYFVMSMEERDGIRNLLRTQFETRDVLYLLSYFIYYMNVEDFKKDIFSYIERGKFDCYRGSMLELQTKIRIEGYYALKRELHRQNVEKYDKEINIKYTYIPVQKRNRKRIVVMTEQLLSTYHAPSLVALNLMYILQKNLGYEVIFFACPTDRGLEKELWYRSHIMKSAEYFRNNKLTIEYRGVEFEGYQINMYPSGQKEYSMMLEIIHSWNPWFVLGLGVCNPVIDLVRKFTTLAVMEMSIECPISEAEIMIRFTRMDESKEEEYQKEISKSGQVQIFMNEEMPALIERPEKSFTREELKLPQKDFLIAIVGNRLDIEVNDEFIQVLEQILKIEQNVSFVFIGTGQEFLEHMSKKIFEGHIYYLGYSDELMKTYGALDLYLNPKRLGGGYSGLFAQAAGLPVVTLPECDVAYNVGKDFLVQDYEDMIHTVCKYIEDEEFYAQKKKMAIQMATKNSEEKLTDYVSKMLENISEIMERKA
ncbi:glycosyltransferase [Roseburia hominis]|uniref:glycosyltransferase n=1 Tax=Roseburia hominis TaxID=301301 RepID=UPI001F184936|nr:glycosyltransferase [Roseburia hominis]